MENSNKKYQEVINWLENDDEMSVLWENKKTPDEVLNKLQLAIDALKKVCEYENKGE